MPAPEAFHVDARKREESMRIEQRLAEERAKSLERAGSAARRLLTPKRVISVGLASASILLAVLVFTDIEHAYFEHTHWCDVSAHTRLGITHSHSSPLDISGERQIREYFFGETIPSVTTDVACLDHAFPGWRRYWG